MKVERFKVYQRRGMYQWVYWYKLIGPEMGHECNSLAQVREIAKRKYGVKAKDLEIVDTNN